MSSATELFKNLFRSAQEGDSSGVIIGREVPKWIKGPILFNGPVGKWDFEKESVKTWFDGQSILLCFKVDHEKKLVNLRKRFQQSDSYQRAVANGRLIFTEYGTPGSVDPEKNFLCRIVDTFVPGEMTDNCACTFYQLGGLVVASTETSLLRVIDPNNLDTKEKIDMSCMVNIASARALQDENGDLYNLAGTFTTGIKYHFIKFPKSDETDAGAILNSGSIVCSIPSRMKTCFSYYHSFGMSRHFLIMIEQPWVANSFKLIASKVKGISFRDCLEWHPYECNRFHVVEKSSGKLLQTVYLSQEPFFFLNFINCFEDKESNLVVDLIGYDSPDIIDKVDLEKLRSNKFEIEEAGKIQRFVLPINTDDNPNFANGVELIKNYGDASAIKEKNQIRLSPQEILAESGCEHPIINPKFRGIKYRFSYVIGWLNSVNCGFFANSITKVDMDSGEVTAWRGGDFCHPTEPIFIPNPSGIQGVSAEDDGVLVSVVVDVREKEKDFLLFLDPKNMTEIARAKFDTDIPFVGHGFYVNK